MMQVISWAKMDASERERVVQFALNEMSSNGMVVLRPTDKEGLLGHADQAEQETILEEFVNQLGQPVGHDIGQRRVWSIKKTDEDSRVPTYSQHDGEAELHTDSQYREYPEEAFALACLHRARCGGGESLVLTMDQILEALREMPEGERHEQVLREEKVPFAVPTIFNTQRDEQVEWVEALIFNGDTMRYRRDTLEAGLRNSGLKLSTALTEALAAVEKAIHQNKQLSRFYLEDGDVLVIDNLRVLHGRTAFTDWERHLLRVRFNFRGKAQ